MLGLACRPSSPVRFGPFEAAEKFGAGVPVRVMPAAAESGNIGLGLLAAAEGLRQLLVLRGQRRDGHARRREERAVGRLRVDNWRRATEGGGRDNADTLAVREAKDTARINR